MTILGVDIGATKIATGLVRHNASVSDARITPTRALDGFDASIAQIWRAIEQSLCPEVECIGICAPGPLNPLTGVVLNPPNLPGWRDVPLAHLAQEKFGLPVRLENDCNAAGLAEARYGAARGCAHVFYAAIGTGIGCGIILDGKIYHGNNGAAGEGGHVTIDYRSSTTCGCGASGCIEALASGSALERLGAAHLDVGEYELDEVSLRLGAWLGGIVSLLDPGIIVIGGNVAQIGEPLLERLRAIMPTRTVNPFAARIPIVRTHFGAEAGVVGAASLFT